MRQDFHFWIYKSKHFLYQKKSPSKTVSPGFSFMPLPFCSLSFQQSFFKLLLFLFYCSCCSLSFLIFSLLEKSKPLQKPIRRKQDCICQVCTMTRYLRNDALTASYSFALALLFPISASGCFTNQFLSNISEGFFFFFSQQPEYWDRDLTVLF